MLDMETSTIKDHRLGMSSALPEWAQAALAMPSRSQRIDVDGCAIHYLTWGDPACPPLVLVHGNAAHAEWWRFIAPLLAAEYHVIALDLGGMGDSGQCGRYERERYVGQIMAVAHAAAPGRAPLIVGHSLGGFVTMMAGAAHGERLAGIIVIDAPVEAPDRAAPAPTIPIGATGVMFPDRASALRRFRLVPEQQVGCQFYFDHIAHHSITEVEGGWRWKFDPLAVAQQRPTAFTQYLLEMRCPVALFWGEHSARFNDEIRAYMRETFGARMPIVEIANTRHHIMLDDPLALVAALRTHLANWGSARTVRA